MPKAKDLTGQRFERLTVIEKTERRDSGGSIIWKCLCDCGNIVFVRATSLIRGTTKSCGCLRNELLVKNIKKDISGQKFGLLTAIFPSEKRSTGSIMWECLCDCGNTVFVRLSSLINGNTKSCGCLNVEVAKKRAIQKVTIDSVEGTRLSYLTKTVFANNSSGVRGVSKKNNSERWTASIGFKKQSYYLGSYDSFEKAAKAREIAEEILWKPILEKYIGKFCTEEERQMKLKEYIQKKIAEEFGEINELNLNGGEIKTE